MPLPLPRRAARRRASLDSGTLGSNEIERSNEKKKRGKGWEDSGTIYGRRELSPKNTWG